MTHRNGQGQPSVCKQVKPLKKLFAEFQPKAIIQSPALLGPTHLDTHFGIVFSNIPSHPEHTR